jgi:hypothetical protein
MLWVPIPNSLGKEMLKRSKTIEKKRIYAEPRYICGHL